MKKCVYLLVVISLVLLTSCAHRTLPDVEVDELATPIEEPLEIVHSPGSLWTPSAKFVDMYADPRAKRVGDIVIVQIVESSSAEKEAKTTADKSNKYDSGISDFLGLPLDQASVLGYKLSPSIQAETSTEFKGNGKTTRKGDISATVSARVLRVLPSDNLLIQGKKQIRLNSEIQYIVISGIIRPEDISPYNTILSTYLADMRLDYYGSGIIGDQQRRGVVSRAIDKIWPF